jgi:hypothetical protein
MVIPYGNCQGGMNFGGAVLFILWVGSSFSGFFLLFSESEPDVVPHNVLQSATFVAHIP